MAAWTDERVELLKKMWIDKVPCPQIGRELGGLTPNAIIGKARRLGLGAHPNGLRGNKFPRTSDSPKRPQGRQPGKQFIAKRPKSKFVEKKTTGHFRADENCKPCVSFVSAKDRHARGYTDHGTSPAFPSADEAGVPKETLKYLETSLYN